MRRFALIVVALALLLVAGQATSAPLLAKHVQPTKTPLPTATLTPTAGPPPSCATSLGGSIPISTDLFVAPTGGQHSSEVEPDTFSNGSTTVSAFQVGRYYDGGATDVGWATFNGTSWTCGVLP